MTIDEVDAIRQRSKAASAGPWVTDFEEMAKKTVMRRLLKRAPMSVELAAAVALDNKAAVGEFDGKDDIINIDGFDVDDADTPADIQSQVNADRTAELRAKVAAKSAPANSVPAEENEFSPMIAAAIKQTGAPTSVPAVLDYATRKGISLTMDADFTAIVNEAAEAGLV
jgi:recombinational DNA repair protein RecT